MNYILPFFLLSAVDTPLPSVSNPLRDLLFYFNNPTVMTLVSAFGNFIWGLFFAPWQGGRAMVQA